MSENDERNAQIEKMVQILHSLRTSISTLTACEDIMSALCSQTADPLKKLSDISTEFEKLKFPLETEERIIKFFTMNGFTVNPDGETMKIKFVTQ